MWKIYTWNHLVSQHRTFPFSSSSFFFFFFKHSLYARLPTPPQAQQDVLVLTRPAPQGNRVACWVQHFSAVITQALRACPWNASRPQPRSLALTESKEFKRKSSYQERRSRVLSQMPAISAWTGMRFSKQYDSELKTSQVHWICTKMLNKNENWKWLFFRPRE